MSAQLLELETYLLLLCVTKENATDLETLNRLVEMVEKFRDCGIDECLKDFCDLFFKLKKEYDGGKSYSVLAADLGLEMNRLKLLSD